jgi:hypothetical protein
MNIKDITDITNIKDITDITDIPGIFGNEQIAGIFGGGGSHKVAKLRALKTAIETTYFIK